MAETEEKRCSGGYVKELKKVSYIAAPMVTVSVLQYLLQVVSVVMVGHLGQLVLSSVAIATSLTNVTGFSLLSGMAGGLETLCGQAYGAQQYQKLGIYTYSAMISLLLVCPPVCVLWIFMDKLLPVVGQDPLISHEARNYAIWLIPALFGSAILKPLTRYLQTQSLILPMMLTSLSTLCFHTVLCWTLVFKFDLGSIGAAIAYGLSTWLNVLVLGLYMSYSSACEKTRASLSRDALLGLGQFFRLAVPSAVMVCLTISTLHFTVPYGFGAASSIRVSNELGAGNPRSARVAVGAAMAIEAVIVSASLFCSRNVLGLAYSNDRQIQHYIAVMTPFLCLSIITDSLQAVLSGVARGCGWQHIGAYINLGAFYLVGLPVGALLGFVAHLRGKGLWIGIVAGSIVQSTLLSLISVFTDWEKQATKAKERVLVRK
ncbi:protein DETOXIFICATION 14-like isoform X2 [Tripterygium wilfordii]|uniref:protein DETOXIFICATION 14-like isoform X2 n=1 Tax=Tripterygium wilfordii TaxID=458696 RepID=UPI0018F827E9|nr:protein DETOXIFICATION 14-like isoform X2 [Tripterygium wilfordii]